MNGIQLTIWDCGGQEKLRSTWRYYYKGTQAVIFVVDCSDRERISICKKELQRREEELLQDISLLVLANKQDMDQAMSGAELTEALRLNTLREGLAIGMFRKQWRRRGQKGLYEKIDGRRPVHYQRAMVHIL